MMKRMTCILVCLVVLLMSGCEFFPVPSNTPGASGADATVAGTVTIDSAAPQESPSNTAGQTTAPAEAVTVEPTEEPTAEPTTEPTTVPDPGEGMIFPNSDTELLMWSELIVLKADKLDLARNEIYARAGYKFSSKTLSDYYGKLSWYKIDPAFSEGSFTDIQRANIKLIQCAERAIKGETLEIKSGTKLDYDQDGTLETLTFTGDDSHMNLKLKDGTTTTPWSISCDTPSKKVYLGDINFKDKLLDLFVDEFGPSDDYAVYVAGIKHHAFLVRTTAGAVPCTIKQIKPDGKGTVTTTSRMNILMTWFCPVKYKLNSAGKLVFVPQASYSMSNFKCKTKVDIPLKASASASSAVALTVPAGTEVKLVSTDDKKWIKITAPGGTGWLEMETLITLANPNIDGIDAFDGLVLAD